MKQRDLLLIFFVFYLIGLGLFTKAVRQPAGPKPLLLSPVSFDPAERASQKQPQTIFYYITTSQGLLNKARDLEDKEKILKLVNEALATISAGITQYPNDDRVYGQRASIYEATIPLAASSAEKARQDLDRAVQLNSQNPQYLSRLANLYLGQNDFLNAAKTWYKAHQIAPVDVQILYNLADALEKSGQGGQSAYYFQKLIALLPANDINLATIRQRQQRLETVAQTAPAQPPLEPMGIEDLPLEQAAAGQGLIIAGSSTSEVSADFTSEVSNNAKSGEGVLPANQKEILVKTPFAQEGAFIYVKALSETNNKVIYVAAKGAGWFKVAIDSPVDFEIKFKWWTIN